MRNKKIYITGIILLFIIVSVSVLRTNEYWNTVTNQDELIGIANEMCELETGIVPPKEFTSDACSMWPDGSWVSCCVEHDYKYWCGGERKLRALADKEVISCVNEKVPFMGYIMYVGVRLGGLSFIPVPWRWGYGFVWPKYK